MLLLVSGVAGAAAAQEAEPRRVVILDAADPSEPVGQAFGQAIRDALTKDQRHPVEFYSEFLDTLRLGGTSYDPEYLALLRRKYRDRPPDLVVTVFPDALGFLERHRAELWPDTPAVYIGVPDDIPDWTTPTRTVNGVRTHVDIAGTLDLAFSLQPGVRRVVVVSGISAFDRLWRERARAALSAYAGRVEVEYADGLPADALRGRLRQLPPDAIVLYNTVFRDADGPQTPIAVGRVIAEASTVPVYSAFEPVLGAGILGGRVVSLAAEAVRAGGVARAILDGQSPEAVRAPAARPAVPEVDWRQLRRFGIAEASLPVGTVVRFRPDSVWSQHRGVIAGVLAVLGLQFGLIAALLVERRHRRLAEVRSRQRSLELAHAARLATMGEITASIAHQINQPLGAILSNADAADLLLEASPLQIDELRQILADIRRDDLRAHEVIQGIRAWLGRHEFQPQPVALDRAAAEVLHLLEREADRLRVALRADLRADLPPVIGDPVHLQQIVLNLVMNGLDAAHGGGDAAVTVRTSLTAAGDVELSVTDTGRGIPPDHLERVFDSFYSTKPEGMGLGLSIARSLVELHGGRIWAEHRPQGGAIFRFVIPAAGTAVPSTTNAPRPSLDASPLGQAQ